MSQASDKVIIGKIGAPYGVKGWVKINSYTE
ncbi:MAG: ribosome maturation factor RimM, partial [Alteromonadaceae bacterium]|nr:ribosome maturation factor RimM [Alteromonadaceae bacterium]